MAQQPSARNQILMAIRAYEADEERFSDDQLRNLTMFAAQEGIPFTPKNSGRRMAMSFLDNLAFGLIPGDFALTKNEAQAGSVGGLLSFLMPLGAVAKGAKWGAKAVKAAATGKMSAKAFGASAKALKASRVGALKAKQMAKLAQYEQKGAQLGGTMAREAEIAIQAERAALKKEADMLGRQISRSQQRPAMDYMKAERAQQFATRIEQLGAQGMGAQAYSGAVNMGAAGAITGGLHGINEGDPVGGAISGGMGGAMLGAIGGPLLPMAGAAAKAHPFAATVAGGLGLSGMAMDY